MELYHITKRKYLTNILTQGLIINSGKTGFCQKNVHKIYKRRYGMQPIFLTNDVEFVLKTMLTKKWVKDYEPIVLKINFETNDRCLNEIAEKEFICYENIKRESIVILKVNLNNYF